MAESSYPTAGGGSVTDAQYEVLMASATGDGLIGRPNWSALVYGDSSGRQVKVRGSRGAIVRGFRWATDSSGLTVPIAANSTGQTRIDRVVLRLDRSAGFTVRVVVLQGTASTTPVAPAPQYTDPPGQFYDMPLAEVTVRTGTTILGAGDVREATWYLAEPMLVGTTAYAPPSIQGRLFRQNDANTLLVGNSGGGWETVTRDSGWIALGPAAGFTNSSGIKVRRKGDICFLIFSIIRSGATISKTTNATIATISTPSYRPVGATIEGVYACSNPDFAANFYVTTAGAVTLVANNTDPINNNAYLRGSTSWPVSW